MVGLLLLYVVPAGTAADNGTDHHDSRGLFQVFLGKYFLLQCVFERV